MALPEKGKAEVRAIHGQASYSQGGGTFAPLKVGTTLQEGASIKTDAGSTVDLFLGDNGSILRVTESTELSLSSLKKSAQLPNGDRTVETQLNLKSGRILGNVKRLAAASKYEIVTPTYTAGIKGTQYGAAVGEIQVYAGKIVVKAAAAGGVASAVEQMVTAGQMLKSAGSVANLTLDQQKSLAAAIVSMTSLCKPELLAITVAEQATVRAGIEAVAVKSAGGSEADAAATAARTAHAVVAEAQASLNILLAAIKSGEITLDLNANSIQSIASQANYLDANAQNIEVTSAGLGNAIRRVAELKAQGGSSVAQLTEAAVTAGVDAGKAAGGSALQLEILAATIRRTAVVIQQSSGADEVQNLMSIVTLALAGQLTPTPPPVNTPPPPHDPSQSGKN